VQQLAAIPEACIAKSYSDLVRTFQSLQRQFAAPRRDSPF
jgi:hypothetical protein